MTVNALGVAKTINQISQCDQQDVIFPLLYHTYNWYAILHKEQKLFLDDFVATPDNNYKFPVILSAFHDWDRNELALRPNENSFIAEIEETVSQLLTFSHSNHLTNLAKDKVDMLKVIDKCPAWIAAKTKAQELGKPVKMNNKKMTEHFLNFYCLGH